MDIFPAACCLAQPMHCDTSETRGAYPAIAPTLQRAEPVCRLHPPATVCRLRTGGRTSPTAPSGATRTDALPQATPASGGLSSNGAETSAKLSSFVDSLAFASHVLIHKGNEYNDLHRSCALLPMALW